jgi:hypothetical protein
MLTIRSRTIEHKVTKNQFSAAREKKIKNRQRGWRTYGVLGARVALRQEQLLAEAAGGRERGDAAQRVCGRGCAGSTGEEGEEHEHEEARGRGERSSWAHHAHRCLLYSLPSEQERGRGFGFMSDQTRHIALRWVRLRLNSDFIDFYSIHPINKYIFLTSIIYI